VTGPASQTATTSKTVGVIGVGATGARAARQLSGCEEVDTVLLHGSGERPQVLQRSLGPASSVRDPLTSSGVGAVVLAERSGSPYEECLAAISMKDMISFVPTIVIVLVGGPYLMVYDESLPPRLRPMFGVFALLVVVALAAVAAVRQYPDRMKAFIKRLANGINRTVGRVPVVPNVSEAEVERRVDNFSASIGEVATNRTTLLLAGTLTTAAFVAQGTLLWLALQAVGVDIQLMLAVFIVPVSLFAAGLPLPGGSGGVEAVQIIIIGGLTAAATGPTTVAVVLSRGLVYWTPIVLGSISLVIFQVQDIAEHA
jgi:uncharacterized protein (TIRG00374 family)